MNSIWNCSRSILLLSIISSFAQAQNQGMISLRAEDSEGHVHSISFGYHADATMGYDFDLGEFPIPPVPTVQAFDLRFRSLTWNKRLPNDGSYFDIRPFNRSARVDTFIVHFQPTDDAYPVLFTWDGQIVQYYSRATLRHFVDGKEIDLDMLRSNVFSASDRVRHEFYIIVKGMKQSTKNINHQQSERQISSNRKR